MVVKFKFRMPGLALIGYINALSNRKTFEICFSNSLIIHDHENQSRGRCLEIGGRNYKNEAKFHLDFLEKYGFSLRSTFKYA